MSVIATIDIPAEEFTLGPAIATNPGLEITLEHVVPVGSTFIPYLWVEDHTVEAIERALRAEADIESFRVVDQVNGQALVRVEWIEDLDGFLDAMAANGATILEGVGRDDRWTFQLRFDDHDALSDFYRQCVDEEITLDVRSVHNPGWAADPGLDFGLTETQRETLEVALEKGYFDVPREVNLTDLAEEMGVSDTAVSQRLRRGTEAILRKTLSESSHAKRRSHGVHS